MENQNLNQNSQIPPQGETIQESRTPSSIGPLVGIIIVIIVIVFGGMYFWGQRIDRSNSNTLPGNDAVTKSLQNQGTSDNVADIEADLNSTDLQNLDKELNQIDSDLQGAGL